MPLSTNHNPPPRSAVTAVQYTIHGRHFPPFSLLFPRLQQSSLFKEPRKVLRLPNNVFLRSTLSALKNAAACPNLTEPQGQRKRMSRHFTSDAHPLHNRLPLFFSKAYETRIILSNIYLKKSKKESSNILPQLESSREYLIRLTEASQFNRL